MGPDSKHLLITDRKNRLMRFRFTANAEYPNQSSRRIPQCGVFARQQWLAYTKTGSNHFDVVYLYNIADDKEYPVTDGWYDSGMPFSAAMESICFIPQIG